METKAPRHTLKTAGFLGRVGYDMSYRSGKRMYRRIDISTYVNTWVFRISE